MADFLGVGWVLPVNLDQNRQIAIAQGEDAIQHSIRMILGTAPGERLMRPDFGCGIHDLVFAPNSAETIGQAVNDVQRALLEWEPRIDVLDVQVVPDETAPNRLLIQVNYRVRSTNNRFNLVYPFYLE
jgi:phage baseplate assembly protein W